MNTEKKTNGSNGVKLYLDYLDKEINIIALLATFCITVPLVILERLASSDHGDLQKWWNSGYCFFDIATILMILAAWYIHVLVFVDQGRRELEFLQYVR